MPDQLEIRLLKNQSYPDKTGELPGYKPALIKMEGKTRVCHVIKPDEFDKLDSILYLMHTFQINLEQQDLDLTELIVSNPDGKKWLESLQAQWGNYETGPIPMNFSLKFLDFKPIKYKQWPEDSMKRITKSMFWRPPQGILHELPEETFFLDIIPPMKWSNGKWIPNLYYKRKVIRPSGEVEEYSISDVTDDLSGKAGVLLGDIHESNLKIDFEFEGGFPRKHYLELCYPVALRRAHKESAHILQVFLKE